MEESTAREMERRLQQMHLKVIQAKGNKKVEGLRPLPEFQSAKKTKKNKERGDNL